MDQDSSFRWFDREVSVATLHRILLASFFSLTVSAGAHSAPNTVPVSKEVISLREAVPGMNDATDINSVADIFAPLQMRVIGGNDATWKRDNPNWMPVLNMVREDLKKDLQPALTAQAADTAGRWNLELATHLSANQINELLGFYGSDTGRRYLAFQKRLIAVQVEGTSTFVTGMASGGLDPKQVVDSAPSAAQLDARKKLVALSWTSQVMPALGPAASPSHGASASDDKAINDMIVDALAKMRGPELDALGSQYQKDFTAFGAFQASPMARALISVYGALAKDIAAEPAGASAAFMGALQHSIELHSPAWKAAYEAGRVAQASSVH
jgi:hypothetical protein